MKVVVEAEDFLVAPRTRAAWDALVAQADCDPLFSGWAWRSTWWRHFGPSLGARAHVLTVRDDAGELVAILPVYVHAAHLKGLPVRRLQLLGGHARGQVDTEFSEYGDACVRRGSEEAAARVLAPALLALGWDDMLALCVREDAWLVRWLLPALTAERRLHVRHVDPLPHYDVDLRDGFDAWLASLSANVRRRAYGQRKKLVAPRFEAGAAPSQVLRDLQQYHVQRWGKTVYSAQRLAFHANLLELLSAEATACSRLWDGDHCLSVLYDIRLGGREYNLQSGFDVDATRGLSPGYLHLTYAIEHAARVGATTFDLLGGGGKVRDYKNDLAQQRGVLHTLHVLKAPWLRLLAKLRGEG